MTIQIFDTQRKKKIPFHPIEEGAVGMYVCGPTVYDLFHIGNARPLVVFDVVARHLRASGFRVTFIRNITDIDDKIIERAREAGEDPKEFATRWAHEYHRDYDRLRCQLPGEEPLATDHIPDMIRHIESLMDKGIAYESGGDVYFSIRKFPDHGALAGQDQEALQVGEGPRGLKRDPADFALWKAAKPGEPSWASPWGLGRPGWHIECSAMAERYLGPTFDIHGGGIDLLFPHHENERSQSQGLNGPGTFARYWMHNGFVGFRQVWQGRVVQEGNKISKSDTRMRELYRMFVARACMDRFGPEAVRYWILTAHYRAPLAFVFEQDPEGMSDQIRFPLLEEAERKIHLAYRTLRDLTQLVPPETTPEGPRTDWKVEFDQSLDDDFNTPVALSHWERGLREAQKVLSDRTPEKIQKAQRILRDLLGISSTLGLLGEHPDTFLETRREKKRATLGVDPAWIEALLAERDQARRDRDFKKADQIRKQLDQVGVQVYDNPTGTDWDIP